LATYALDDTRIEHVREVYTFYNLLGDLGGIQGLIVGFWGFFLFSWSEFTFTIKALQKLYLVRSKDATFIQTNSHKKKTLTLLHEMPSSYRNTDFSN